MSFVSIVSSAGDLGRRVCRHLTPLCYAALATSCTQTSFTRCSRLRFRPPRYHQSGSMARKKQSLKRTSSASGSGAVTPTSPTSPSSRTAALPHSVQAIDANHTAPPISPNDYFTSDKPDYRMPKITEPLEYLTVLWRRYEATFAISMFETVRDRASNKQP